MSARSSCTDLRTAASRLAAAAAIALLAACGGGGATSPSGAPVPQPSSTVAATGGTGTAQFVVVGGSTGLSSKLRRPRYVSVSTAAVAIAIDGTPVEPVTIAQTCSVVNQTDLTCTETFPAPAGNHVFGISLLDGSQTVLSQGTVNATITAGKTTTLHLVFGGVPKSVSLQLDQTTPPVGTPATLKLTASAYDADRNLIIADPYATPITITDDDKTGQVTLSKTTFSTPADTITVSYSGKLMPNPVTFSVTSPAQSYPTNPMLTPNPYTVYGQTTYALNYLAAGPDGNVWFSECATISGSCKIGKVTPSGVVTEFADVPFAAQLTAGPDGNVWFTEDTQPYIGRITPSGQETQFLIPSRAPVNGDGVGPIVVGPDGNVWFAEGDRIGSITMSGNVNEYSIGGLYRPNSLIVGSDGALWFSEGYQIGRITTAGVVTQYAVDTTGVNGAGPLALGPDGKLYFSGQRGTMRTMTMAGTIAQVPLTPSNASFGLALGRGPDGNMWGSGGTYDPYGFAQGNGISSATFGGVVTTYLTVAPPTLGSTVGLRNGAWGPDGNLWFGGYGPGIVRFRYDP